MIACIDVDYREDAERGKTTAVAACVVLPSWRATRPASEEVCVIPRVAAYTPGLFYKRELPCVLAVLEQVEEALEVVVVDGYVFLDAHGRPGLGSYLHDALEQRVAVVGVAKSAFRANEGCIEVLRGESKLPLYVTAVGIEPQRAADEVRNMHGRFRFPDMLKRVDRLCRDARPGITRSKPAR